MPSAVALALFGWLPVVLALFAILPVRRALIASYVAGWLLLPEATYRIAGPLPNYGKVAATCLLPLGAAVLRAPQAWRTLRPSWVDLAIVVWCLCPLGSSLSNGLGVHDGMSAVLDRLIAWGAPYVLGRVYLSDREGTYELVVGIFIGGLLYVPLCLAEVVQGPFLHALVYGFPASDIQAPRFVGWRPMVFLRTGLTVAMWMVAASAAAIWLAQRKDTLAAIPTRWLLALVVFTTLLTQSVNAWVLLSLACVVVWSWRQPRVLGRARIWVPVAIVVALPIAYVGARVSMLSTGRMLIPVAKLLGSERATSVEYRVESEIALVEKAHERLWLGWAKWGRATLDRPKGQYGTIRDSLWVIAFGDHGLVGLISVMAVLLLPIIALWCRWPVASWSHSPAAASALLALIVALYALDCCFNAMANPVYVLAAGAVSGFVIASPPASVGD